MTSIASNEVFRTSEQVHSCCELDEERRRKIQQEFDELDSEFIEEGRARGETQPLSFRDVVRLCKETRAEVYADK